MWIVFFIFLEITRIAAHIGCILTMPSTYPNSYIYTTVFHWQEPYHSYDSSVEYISDGDLVEFTCESGFVNELFVRTSYVFQCTNGLFNGSFYYEDLLCRSDFHRNTLVFPCRDVDSLLFKCRGQHLQTLQVGVKRDDGTEQNLYQVCLDKSVMKTKFVFQPPRDEVPTRTDEPRNDVWGLDYFGKNAEEKLKLSKGFDAGYQKIRFANAFPYKYNRKKAYPYSFNRGHLAPWGDFSDLDEKRSSCELINVAPQWVEFNGNTWSTVEQIVRGLLKQNPNEWEIYTGTLGSISTQRGPLYVSPFFDECGRFVKGFVPIPRLYWKIAYNVVDDRDSRVFVGVNNPELKSPDEFGRSYLVCKPLELRKGVYFMGNEFYGFAYECDLNDFLHRLSVDEHIIRVSINSLGTLDTFRTWVWAIFNHLKVSQIILYKKIVKRFFPVLLSNICTSGLLKSTMPV